jgi:hypothetical protein
LPEVLSSLNESLKWEDELASHTKKLLMYPAFVGTIVLGATFFLMIYMVPQLKQFVKNMGQTLPPQTQLLFFVSDLLVGYWWLFLILPVLAVVTVNSSCAATPSPACGSMGHEAGACPIVGPILKKIILSRFANTFAMLYAAGIPILESIRTTQDIVGNRVVRKALAGSSSRYARARTSPAPSTMPASSRRSSCACCASARTPAASTSRCSTSAILQPRRQGIGRKGADPDRTDADRVHGRPARLDHALGHRPDLRRHQQDQDVIAAASSISTPSA